MKDLVYPAILIKDDEKGTNTGEYTILLPDLGLSTEGVSVEDAYIKAKAILCSMVDCAIKYDCEIESPTDFLKVYNDNKKYIVILVDALA